MFNRFRRHPITIGQLVPVLSDEELVRLYQKSGASEPLGILYERYVELVYGVCLKYLKNSTLAEDAVMSIFESLMEKVKTHDIRQFRPWLHVVAKNYCLMQLRKKNLTVSYDDLPPGAVHSSEVVHPVEDFEPDEQQVALKRCLEKLTKTQRSCVEQFYFEEKSYKEIADQSGEELGMVRSHIQNGRRNLRICMEGK